MNEPIKILHLEDNPNDAELVRATFKAGGVECAIVRVETREAFESALERQQFDLVISDFALPSYDGMSALKFFRRKHAEVPFIFVSGTMGEEAAVESLKEGATDYILKDRLSRLGASVERAMQEARARADRRRIAEELRQSSELFRQITESADDLIAVLDANGKRLFSSSSYTRILGDPTGATGTDSFAEVHPEDKKRIRELFRQTVETGAGRRAEYRLIARDGSVHFIESQGSVLRDEEGRVARVVVVARDITERRRAEEKVREQAALLDKAQDAICLKDMNQHVLYWNKGAERLYGWTTEEALGKNANELLFPENPNHSLEASKDLIRRNEWHGTLHNTGKDGRKIIVESRWTLLRDEAGEPRSILVIDTDVTEKKQIEAQLLRTQRMQSIGAVAGGIAHDLNNMLAPILMVADLLREELASEHSRQMLDTAKASAQRGAEMVQQILAFARGVGGELKIIQLKHLVTEMVRLIKDTFPRSIQIRSHVDKEPDPISGDAAQLNQVLLNLCVNARDAMPDGGTLRIGVDNTLLDRRQTPTLPAPVSGKFVIVTVSDTGCGIPAELRDRIFEPFFTTKEPGKGTGLGLSTVLEIVKTHRGFVEVASEPGKGTIFEVYLPAATRTDTELIRSGVPMLQMGRGEIILLADDEAAVLEITKATLEAFNYRVITARDGAEALILYQQHIREIDVVLTDMEMPVMDGEALVRELRKLTPEARVICISGLESEPGVTAPAHLNRQAFLTKPYTIDKLLNTVRDVLAVK
jgi:PAS domain S-box-containing protein